MPGLHVVQATDRTAPGAIATLTRAGTAPGLVTTVHHVAPALAVVSTGYAAYPVRAARAGRWLVVLEGHVYDAPGAAATDALLALAPRVLEGDVDGARRWVHQADADAVAVLVDTATDRAAVLTDRYGRLPLHHGGTAVRRVVSRDVRAIATLLDDEALDRRAIADFLLFGHPLGTATLFRAVRRVPPGALVTLEDGRVVRLASDDLEARIAAAPDSRAAARDLVDALVVACRGRLRAGTRPVLSLSGGIDSRLVAGATIRAGGRPVAVTHVDVEGRDRREAEAAGEVAAALDMEWHVMAHGAPTGEEVGRLLRLKHGANYLGMSRVVPFLDRVAARFGTDVVFFTGDEGDRILGPVAPPVPLRDAAAVARYLLHKEAILPVEAVADATGIPAPRLVDDLTAYVAQFPERDGPLRYVHFMLWERAVRWAFEGEDRNRCWFWSVTPFWAPGVFERAMALPPGTKALHRMRVRALQTLAPELAAIEDVSTGARVDGRAFRTRQRLRRLGRGAAWLALRGLGAERMRRWRGGAPGYAPGAPVLELVEAQLAHPAVEAYLEPQAVRRILARAVGVPREQFSVVYTVTSLIQALGSDVAALERFRAVPLG